VKKAALLSCAFLLLSFAVVMRGETTPESNNTTMSGKINLEIVGVTYDTLTLVNCFNVDVTKCTIKNLVLVRCWNIDVVDSAFTGEGIAVLADSSIAVAITGCTFSETYSQKLMSIHSAKVSIE
jgi:hypothetical protein